MKKLLLAGALVLAVACQKETIEEQANDFVSIEGSTAKNAIQQWDLGEGFGSNVFGSDTNNYIESFHDAVIDGVNKKVFVTFINEADTDSIRLSGLVVATDFLTPDEKSTVLIPSEIDEFKFNRDTGEFYFNGVFGKYGNVSIEIGGTVKNVESHLRTSSYREFSVDDEFEINGFNYVVTAIREYDQFSYYSANYKSAFYQGIGSNSPHLDFTDANGVETTISTDYYVEFTVDQVAEYGWNYVYNYNIPKFRIYYKSSGEVINVGVFRRLNSNPMWVAYNTWQQNGTYNEFIASLNVVTTLDRLIE